MKYTLARAPTYMYRMYLPHEAPTWPMMQSDPSSWHAIVTFFALVN